MRQVRGDGKSPTFPFPTKRLTIHDGEVAYFDEGEGPEVILVHGLVGDFTHFEHVATRLVARGHRVIGVDLPGCGASHKRRERHGVARYARDVLDFMDALDLEEASLVGHSAGGAIVAEAALQAPQRVMRLGLLSSAGMRGYPPGARLATRAIASRWLLERTLERLAMPLLDLIFVEKNAYTEKFVRDALDRPAESTCVEMARVMSDLLPELVMPSVLDRAALLRQPTLVLWGATDRLVPPDSVKILQRRLAQATFTRLPACGHMPMIERPEATSRALAAFLEPELERRRIEPRRAA